jgi:hypothetical protein
LGRRRQTHPGATGEARPRRPTVHRPSRPALQPI